MDEICEKEYQPTVVITDQGQTEINAIRDVFSYELRIFYCAWHVLQAWERNLTIKNLGMADLSKEEKERRKNMIREELRNILYSKTEKQANLQVEAFKAKWEEHTPKLMEYLNENYLNSEADRRRWMFCYREGVSYGWINTNNYIESWHNTLKKHFFKDRQQRRIDTVIYILVNKAIPHYQQMSIRHTVQVGRMTPARRNALVARQTAMEYIDQQRIQDPDATLLFQTLDDTVLQVRSFTNADIVYDIKVDWTRGLAELPYTKFYYKGHWDTRDEGPLTKPLFSEDDSLPPISYPSAALTPSDLAIHYIQKLSGLMNILDSESPLPNHQEILDSLKKSYELCERHFPVLPEHNLSRKRARQRE
ncbi:hypothetical protein BGZ80_007152 [Entomortierella chlamydospora]|uniref:MULE transposase domain-containing protein n=1 Tax=Entomortierella chlamydospora TaxID=101097 RepID=A0A9P6MFI4_9FUNG|nr:hypothetical protein BGZ80_007152 [Entomortierella chlamydospora]